MQETLESCLPTRILFAVCGDLGTFIFINSFNPHRPIRWELLLSPFFRRGTQDAERLSDPLEVTRLIVAELECESGSLQSPLRNPFALWPFAGISTTLSGPSLFLHSFSPLESTEVLRRECASESPGGFVKTVSSSGLAWDLRICHFYVSQVLLVRDPTLGTTVMLYN